MLPASQPRTCLHVGEGAEVGEVDTGAERVAGRCDHHGSRLKVHRAVDGVRMPLARASLIALAVAGAPRQAMTVPSLVDCTVTPASLDFSRPPPAWSA